MRDGENSLIIKSGWEGREKILEIGRKGEEKFDVGKIEENEG